MATVEVKLMGPLRRPEGLEKGLGAVKIPQRGCSVDELLSTLGFSQGERRRFQLLIDDEQVNPSTRVEPGQQVTLFLPLGGG